MYIYYLLSVIALKVLPLIICLPNIHKEYKLVLSYYLATKRTKIYIHQVAYSRLLNYLKICNDANPQVSNLGADSKTSYSSKEHNARGIAWQIAVQVDADKNIKCEDNELRKDFQARLMRERYDRFSDIFQDCKENFPADFKRFQAIFPPLRNKFSRWNHRKVTERNQYTAAFNIKAWNELSPAMQIEHTFKDCKPCQLKFNKIQALFPVKSNRFSNILKENNLSAANKAIEVRLPNQTCINSSTTSP